MSEDFSVDPGLEELTSEVLGPDPNASAQAPTQTDAATDATQPEQLQAQDAAAQSSPPTAPVTPAPVPDDTFIELDGRKFNRNAVEQTLRQFPHLQRLYVEQKQREDQFKSQQEAAQRDAQAPQMQPRQMQAQLRAAYDGAVAKAVQDGVIEEDFATLYPDLAVNMLLNRDALVAFGNQVKSIAEEIRQYKSNIGAERVKSDVLNNMVALSTTDPAMSKLSDESERTGFFQYLVQLSPRREQLTDPEFYRAQYVAFHGNDFLSAATAAQAAAKAKAEATAIQKRRTGGIPQGSARPAPAPPAQGSDPLMEMVTDEMARRAGR